MSISARVIADSISESHHRITTLQLAYPRFIHAEFMTHRVFSRNASSSRAIPVRKMIDQIRQEPAMPIHWGQNQPGMQADNEIQHAKAAEDLWRQAARHAAYYADQMHMLGLHKQVANRILEPFQTIHVVVTATDWQNFFDLRLHKDAQPEIQALAYAMHNAMDMSMPKLKLLNEWHLPYLTEEEEEILKPEIARQVSAARCCRVSYLKHDGNHSTVKEDLALCKRLAGARPIHASPFEHQATPDRIIPFNSGSEWEKSYLHGNFSGWIQSRKIIERE